MLDNIKIQNYRNLKHLNVEKLGHVNLIIGRNNTGKTSLLEALFLFQNPNDTDSIYKILVSRGEGNVMGFLDGSPDGILQSVNNLFWNRNENKFEELIIVSEPKYLKISVKNKILEKLEELSYLPGPYVLEVERNEFNFPRHIIFRDSIKNLEFFPPIDKSLLIPKNVKFVRSSISEVFVNNHNQLASYLDSISLGDNYNYVVEALQIIDHNIERVAYLSDKVFIERIPVARLKNGKKVLLSSMGDGINRILTIILAMVTCENGYLLIDEFENGLHYSVQEKLWEIIFHLAERLNIQVFATTHSNDTILAFENIVNQNETVPLDGLLIKLENIEDTIEATTFEPNELKIITDNLIEVRR